MSRETDLIRASRLAAAAAANLVLAGDDQTGLSERDIHITTAIEQLILALDLVGCRVKRIEVEQWI